MKVIMVAVSSLNGKITNGDDSNIYQWTAKEDQSYLTALIKKHKLVVMGSGTYEAARKIIKPKPGIRRIVLTRRPEKYMQSEISGQLEFCNLGPKELIKKLERQGYPTMLLLGGSVIYTLFLEEHCVDEIYLTLEPKLFGVGKGLVEAKPFDASLKLISLERLNSQGTLLLKY